MSLDAQGAKAGAQMPATPTTVKTSCMSLDARIRSEISIISISIFSHIYVWKTMPAALCSH